MTDATELALLAGVCAAPEDDTARLVYADWLQENGQERAAVFIRKQITGEIATVPMTWATRIEGVLACQPHQCGFFAERGRAGLRRNMAPAIQVTYTRGFPSELHCTAENFLAHADALIWRPGATMECPECKGHGFIAYHSEGECPECGEPGVVGSGRIPRPCPPTAQPITRVTLTTNPNIVCLRPAKGGWLYGWAAGEFPDEEFSSTEEVEAHRSTDGVIWHTAVVNRLLHKRWPDVDFSFPNASAHDVVEPLPAPDLPPADDGPDLSGYVACGNGHVPADGYAVEIEGASFEYEPGGDSKTHWPIRSHPSRAVFILTYPLTSQMPMPPSMSNTFALVFGPISGTNRHGWRVTVQRAMLRRVEIQMQGSHVARVSVEAVAVGEVTLA